MANTALIEDSRYYQDIAEAVPPSRKRFGRILMWSASFVLGLVLILQILSVTGAIEITFETWRPTLYAYVGWSIILGIGQVLTRGQAGWRALFVLPAALFTVAVVVFPTLFGFYIASLDWNLSSLDGPTFFGFGNLVALAKDPFYWNALVNMIYYVGLVAIEYAIAFGLALLLNTHIRGRKFFRIVFLLPFMLSPVAVSWMIGKSMLEARFGPAAALARWLGWDNPAFFGSPWIARLSIELMDAWMTIPFMMILLLAGLQALPREVMEAARVDGATRWQTLWKIIFPLMLPVSVTAILIRTIFKLKLADIVINVTSGGPGGATDTVSSLIFRVYRDRSNVGYGTALAVFYLIMIIIFLILMLNVANRLTKHLTSS